MNATGRIPGRDEHPGHGWDSGEDLEDRVALDRQEAGEVDEILEELAELVPDEDEDLPHTPRAAEEAAMHVYREPLGDVGTDERIEDAALAARTQLARATGSTPAREHEPDLDEWVATHEA